MEKQAKEVAKYSITRTEDTAIRLMEEGTENILAIENQLNQDIEELLDNVDER